MNFYSKSTSNLKKFLWRTLFLPLNHSKPYFISFFELGKVLFRLVKVRMDLKFIKIQIGPFESIQTRLTRACRTASGSTCQRRPLLSIPQPHAVWPLLAARHPTVVGPTPPLSTWRCVGPPPNFSLSLSPPL
jgi:hypothetical protein